MTKSKLMKIIMASAAAVTLVVCLLTVLSVIKEFDKESGFFVIKAPCHTAANVLIWAFLAVAIAASFCFKKRELYPVINGDNAVFRFFSSLAGCMSAIEGYVRVVTYRANMATTDPIEARGNLFTLICAVFCFLSVICFIAYAFGKNDGRTPKRAIYASPILGMLVMRLLESHFTWSMQLNNPIKISLQLALIAASLGVLYTLKCELRVDETPKRIRLVTLLVTPVFCLSYAVLAITAYLTKMFPNLSLLTDSLLLTAVTGFVLSSYTPEKKAKGICLAEWEEHDRELETYMNNDEPAEYTEPEETAEPESSYTADDASEGSPSEKETEE